VTSLDLDGLAAIDVHVHVEKDAHRGRDVLQGEPNHPTVPELAAYHLRPSP
jgi:hypothetical protein